MTYSLDSSNCHLDTIVFKPDTAGHFDDIVGNTGATYRGLLFKPDEEVELVGRLHVDMFDQRKFLLDNINIGITFELNNPSFYLQKITPTNTSHLKILDATLYMDHVKVNPELALHHQQTLNSGVNVVYNYKRCEVRNFLVGPNLSSFAWDNVCNGPLPDFVLFAMVDSEAYNGHVQKNPFNFQHFDLNSFNASVNGIEVAPRNLAFNFTQKNPLSQHAYFSLFKQLNLHRFDKANIIDRNFYNNGGFILAYDLTPDRDNDCGNFVNSGALRVEAKFKKPLPQSITVLAYMQFDCDLIVDKERNVFTNYV